MIVFYYIPFRSSVSLDEFVVLVTLHVVLDILVESRIVEWFFLQFEEPQNGSRI